MPTYSYRAMRKSKLCSLWNHETKDETKKCLSRQQELTRQTQLTMCLVPKEHGDMGTHKGK